MYFESFKSQIDLPPPLKEALIVGKLITQLKKLIAVKQKKAVYYWAGFGDNPLKQLGVEDWKK